MQAGHSKSTDGMYRGNKAVEASSVPSKELLQSLKAASLPPPTDQQWAAAALVKGGRDVHLQSSPGLAKVVFFAMICMERFAKDDKLPQIVVLSPTREAAQQIADVIGRAVADMPERWQGMRVGTFIGGTPIEADQKVLRRVCHVAVGTPGRVCALVDRGDLVLPGVRLLILDEANVLMAETFKADVCWLHAMMTGTSQVVACCHPLILAGFDGLQGLTRSPATMNLGQQQMLPPRHAYHLIPEALENSHACKVDPLLEQLAAREYRQALVFCSQPETAADLMGTINSAGHPVACITGGVVRVGDVAFTAELFNYRAKICVTTDADIPHLKFGEVDLVVSFDVAPSGQAYRKRTGCLARTPAATLALSLAQAGDVGRLLEVTAGCCDGKVIQPLAASEVGTSDARDATQPPTEPSNPQEEQDATHVNGVASPVHDHTLQRHDAAHSQLTQTPQCEGDLDSSRVAEMAQRENGGSGMGRLDAHAGVAETKEAGSDPALQSLDVAGPSKPSESPDIRSRVLPGSPSVTSEPLREAPTTLCSTLGPLDGPAAPQQPPEQPGGGSAAGMVVSDLGQLEKPYPSSASLAGEAVASVEADEIPVVFDEDGRPIAPPPPPPGSPPRPPAGLLNDRTDASPKDSPRPQSLQQNCGPLRSEADALPESSPSEPQVERLDILGASLDNRAAESFAGVHVAEGGESAEGLAAQGMAPEETLEDLHAMLRRFPSKPVKVRQKAAPEPSLLGWEDAGGGRDMSDAEIEAAIMAMHAQGLGGIEEEAIEDDLGALLDSVSEEEASHDVGPLETAGISFDLDGNGVDTAVTEYEEVISIKAQQSEEEAALAAYQAYQELSLEEQQALWEAHYQQNLLGTDGSNLTGAHVDPAASTGHLAASSTPGVGGDAETASLGATMEARTQTAIPFWTPADAVVDSEGFVRVPLQLLARYHELEQQHWSRLAKEKGFC